MTNEETLNLLKPIMLDGTEKEGDKVFHATRGYCKISQKITSKSTNTMLISIQYDALSFSLFTDKGFVSNVDIFPTLFRVNPFEWLAKNNNQERVVEVKNAIDEWMPRVLIKVIDGKAVIWRYATTIESAKSEWLTEIVKEWRELPTEKVITKDEALKMLAEKGYDTTNLIIE